MTASDLFDAFPALADLGAGGRAALIRGCDALPLPAGARVFEAGQRCERYLMLRAGSVRVHLLDQDGHEIVLYRLGRGDTCILTTAALLGAMPYGAYAVTETPTEATGLSAALFDTLLADEARFRRFVFAAHARRILDLMGVIADVAFTRIPVRLAHCLTRRAGPQGRVAMTHEAIAVEIGTAREVVSRNLKVLERAGALRLGQGVVTIIDASRLADLTEHGRE